MLAVTSIALGTAPLSAQVNIERLRRTDLPAGFAGQAGLDFTLRAGNVDLLLLVPSARIDHRAERWIAFVLGQGDFGWRGGERFSSQALGHIRVGRHLSPRLTLEVFSQIDYDRPRRLTLRWLVGTGPRIHLVAREGWRVALGTAWMFEHEELDLPPEAAHPRETRSHRWSNYLTAAVRAGERLAAAGTVYAQPRFDDMQDIRLLGDARVAVQLVGTLSLQVSGALRWDGRPPDETEKLDLSVRTGVSVEW
jgi:hypothetical protein